MTVKRPLVLAILDGWGIGEDDAHNAIYLADTPNIDKLLATYPNGPIGAAGEHVGLEPGHQGSSEMGHLIIGAGRNVVLPQMQVQQALDTGSIFKNEAYLKAIRHAKERGSRLHLFGLLSNAGVHSYDTLCHALLEMAAKEGLTKEQVYIHIFSDGRDSSPTSLPTYVNRLEEKMKETGVGIIASVQGRWWVMDRDHNWDRINVAYDLLTQGKAKREAKNIYAAIELARRENETDEQLKPTIIDKNGIFKDNDAVINFNYRVDREIEITQALVEPDFDEFHREVHPGIFYIATMPYYDGMPSLTAFDREELKMRNILGEVLAREGLMQYRVTETEKWAYLTKIFNAMQEGPFEGEERHLIPSDKVNTFDEKPEMQAVPIAENIVVQLQEKKYDVIFTNICNADMVGHTGNQEAAIRACQAIDRAIGLIREELKKQNGILLITADHGDAEVMWDPEHDMPHTQHTDSFVPFIYIDDENKNVRIRETGALKDIAPTILDLLNIDIPGEMEGKSLLVPKK
ncbi:MAG: 2,3-bisphosphoglycerate-independent phosphoglycerate mutase [Candidatus Kerfeldbacteria bacterium]